MRRVAAVTMATITLVVGPALTTSASAAPLKKCDDNPENFTLIDGVCVSDGRAERLDGPENETENETEKD